MPSTINKKTASDLAHLGGTPLFDRPRSTSNLVQPDIERFLDYSRHFFSAGQVTNDGPLVKELERRLAEFHDTRHCVSFCSGFWGLVLAMQCVALPGRKEVIMPSLTYRRMADVAAWAGLTPHFCDVSTGTLAISPATVEPLLGPDTALILGVHPFVNCCDAAGLEELATKYRIPLLFDSVESVYESTAGRKVGSFGNAECFSMHASKLLNGFEGGYLTTNDSELASLLANRRAFGFIAQDTVSGIGINAKLNEIHAAMALASLDDLDAQVERNRARYRVYQSQISEIPGIRLLEFDESEPCSFKNIVVELTEEWPLDRTTTLALLNAEGVLARAYYSPPLHSKKYSYTTLAGLLPNTDALASRFMLMPCGHMVSPADIVAIASLLRFIHAQATDILTESL